MMIDADLTDYPASWFRIAFSADIAVGDVKIVHFFERDFMICRFGLSELAVINPYNSQMERHLGHRWKIVNNQLCYLNKVVNKDGLTCYPLQEVYGIVFIYFDMENPLIPRFSLPDLTILDSTIWPNRSRFRKTIATTVFDIHENAVDRAHFGILHPPAFSNRQAYFISQIKLTELSDKLLLHSHINVAIGPIKLRYDVNANYAGAGIGIVVVEGGLFSHSIVVLTTPITRKRVDIEYIFQTKKFPFPLLNRLLHAGIKYTVATEIDKDVSIWEAKRFVEQPILSDFDGPIAKFRKFFSKFYPKKTIGDLRDTAPCIASHEIP